MSPIKSAFAAAVILTSAALHAETFDSDKRIPWEMDAVYAGPFQNSFNKLRYEVPVLMRQTLIDLAVRTGLDFREGWRFPLSIGFVDHTPLGAENALAYVQLFHNGQPDQLQQALRINLPAYERERFNFDKVFAHELVHAMVNDALGGASVELPIWFHEGLAVYGANQGDQMVAAYVTRYPSNVRSMINGLDGPHGALDYGEDYLAFKYIHDRHGVNSLHNFIREVIRRQGDIPGAVQATCFEDWETFQTNARAFAENEVDQIDRRRRDNINAVRPQAY